jgi:hypothetical protein
MPEFFSCAYLRILHRDSLFDGEKDAAFYCLYEGYPKSCKTLLVLDKCPGKKELVF